MLYAHTMQFSGNKKFLLVSMKATNPTNLEADASREEVEHLVEAGGVYEGRSVLRYAQHELLGRQDGVEVGVALEELGDLPVYKPLQVLGVESQRARANNLTEGGVNIVINMYTGYRMCRI